MKKISIVFSAIIFAVLISNGASSAEDAVAIRAPSPLGSLINAILDPIFRAIKSIANVINGLVLNLEQILLKTLPKAIQNLVETIVKSIAGTTSEAVRNILQTILTLIDEELANIYKLIDRLVERQKELAQIIADIQNNILEVVDEIRFFLERCLHKIPIQAIGIVRRLTSDATKCASGTIELVTKELTRVNGVVEAVSGLIDGVLGQIGVCLESEEEVAVVCLEDVEKVIKDNLKEIQDSLKIDESISDALAALNQCIEIVRNVANSTLTC